MINDENLNKIYEEIVSKNALTTKELNSYGFSSKDISILIQDGIITRIKRGYYIVSDVKSLEKYGKKMLRVKKYDIAQKYFEKCYELEPGNLSICFKLFMQCIIDEEYEKSLKYIDNLLLTENSYYRADTNLYLYLLSHIIDIPHKYEELVNNLNVEDVTVNINDKRFVNNDQSNKIRIAILNRKFAIASQLLNKMTQENGYITKQEIIIKKLLNGIKNIYFKKKNLFIELIQKKDYETLILKLNEEDSNNVKYSYMKLLANDILEIIKTNKIPHAVISEDDNIYVAIDNYNYELALRLCKKRNGENCNSNEIYLLLVNICNLKNKIIQDNFERLKNREIIDEDEKYICEKRKELLKNRGIILLKAMDKNRRLKLKEIAKKYGDITTFSLGEGEVKEVILKYRLKTTEHLNVEELVEEANIAFRNRKYHEAIDIYLKLLENNIHRPLVYGNLGHLYMMIGKSETAALYFSVAMGLAKELGKKCDFNRQLDIMFKKPIIEIEEKVFDDKINEYYGISNFPKLNEYILSSKLDVTTACINFGMSSDEVNLVKLIYAKEYYIQGDYEKGDEFLKSVIETKNKSELINEIIRELNLNKKFYINRVDEERPVLTLSLRPSKK